MAVAKLALFVVTIIASVNASAGPADLRPRRIARFIVLVVGLTVAAGIFRVDAWPFTRYPMLMYVGSRDTPVSDVVVRAVDRRGREHAVDASLWSPMFPTALAAWLERRMPALDPVARDEALAYLLARAEAQRGKIASGQRIGSRRWLAFAAAPPDWGVYQQHVSSDAYRGLRVYRVQWTTAEPRKKWTLLAEYQQH